MDTSKAVLHDTEEKMKKSLDSLFHQFSTLRSGRANAGMVENIKVDSYGSQMPLKQLANIAVPEPKSIVITPWDPSLLKAVEKAIMESDIGIHPITEAKSIRLAVPTLTRERREELAKLANKAAEECRVSIRNMRRDGNEGAKKLEKDKKITEDESFKLQTDVQKLTDRIIQQVDQAQAQKDKELTTL